MTSGNPAIGLARHLQNYEKFYSNLLYEIEIRIFLMEYARVTQIQLLTELSNICDTDSAHNVVRYSTMPSTWRSAIALVPERNRRN